MCADYSTMLMRNDVTCCSCTVLIHEEEVKNKK